MADPTFSLTLAATDIGDTLVVWLLVMACAVVVTLGLRRVRAAVIPGYVIAGAIIAPLIAEMQLETDAVGAVADLAILLLMFGLGLHMDLGEIKHRLLSIVAIGVVSWLLTTVVGVPIALAAGLGGPAAVGVSMAFSMSSTAVVIRLLQQKRQLKQPHGRVAFGVLLVQDLIVVVVLALIPLLVKLAEGADGTLGAGGGPVLTLDRALELLAQGFLVVGAIGLFVSLGRVLLPKALALAARDAHADLLLVLSAGIALGAAVMTWALGLSAELGAFLAGFLLAGTQFRHQLDGQIAPIRDLFMAVFFTTVGLEVDIGVVGSEWWVVLIGVAVVIVVKGALIGAAAWVVGASPSVTVRAALALAQGGEFTLLVLAESLDVGLVDERTTSVTVAIVAGTLIATPAMLVLGERLAPVVRSLPGAPWARGGFEENVEKSGAMTGHVVIAGFGPVGRYIAERLDACREPYTVIELNPRTVETHRRLGRSFVYGDATNASVLESAGVDEASAVVLTMPDDNAVLRACLMVRRANPDVFLAARVSYLSKALAARQVGADHVVAEEIATAEAMVERVTAEMERAREAREAANQAGGLRLEAGGAPARESAEGAGAAGAEGDGTESRA